MSGSTSDSNSGQGGGSRIDPSVLAAQNAQAQQTLQDQNNSLNQPMKQPVNAAQNLPNQVAPPADPMGQAQRIDHTNKSYQYADGGFLPAFLGSAAQTYGDQRWGKNAKPKSTPAQTTPNSSGNWSQGNDDYDTSRPTIPPPNS